MTRTFDNPLIAGLDEVRNSWRWFLALGILLTVLGVVCIVCDVTTPRTVVDPEGQEPAPASSDLVQARDVDCRCFVSLLLFCVQDYGKGWLQS